MVAAPLVRPYVDRYSFAEPEDLSAVAYLQWWQGLVGCAREGVYSAIGRRPRRLSEINEIDTAIMGIAEALHHVREPMIPLSEAGYPVLESLS